ncbi:sensor histidine kinase [uncultured Clostridium sp.]|uniref:sensor histidine kinase n=1 Tax=uncultured Clostridium sp. TaxID=59620 RepID=UPI0025E46232|nr:sensor histidine kinase [uncultured Clostridium sp.]
MKGNIFISYLKERFKVIIAFVTFVVIFFIVYSLYHISVEPILYSSILVVTLAMIFSIYDFYKYYANSIKIKSILRDIQYIEDSLPESRCLLEQYYQEIIKNLYERNKRMESISDNNNSEMIEYYTMWVHQIKTPIAALHMILQSMELGKEKRAISQELFKIEQYVEMALHFVRMGTMSSDLRLESYSIKSIVNDVIKKYSTIFINKKIKLNLEDIDIEVITDEKWISFVLEQIISNALKYTKKGTISIYMDNKSKETLVIEDTGIGIAKEDIPRVFERGFTGYNGRMDKKSTGIGLYLCKKILDNLSHKINIDSEIGKGTTVAIDFSRKNIEIL